MIKLKGFNSTCFSWPRSQNVFLNQTKVKTAVLAACGFLLGAFQGFLHREEAEEELRHSLYVTIDEPFELSDCTISIPIQDGKPEKIQLSGHSS
jgi:hypothetical protein